MSAYQREQVLEVHHWSEGLFSFRTTRDSAFRFESGHFVMLGLEVDGKPLLRAYSIASPSWEGHLDFYSIKVPDGELTSRLQHLEPGDHVLVGRKPVGTLVLRDLRPGSRLFLLASGTGLAPFLSIVQDLETYERFEQVVLVHSVRHEADLAYRSLLERGLAEHEILGPLVRDRLRYLPIVTREPFPFGTRIPAALRSGALCDALGIAPIDPETDRAMICGSRSMLRDTRDALVELGLRESPSQGEQGDFVFERAFVER